MLTSESRNEPFVAQELQHVAVLRELRLVPSLRNQHWRRGGRQNRAKSTIFGTFYDRAYKILVLYDFTAPKKNQPILAQERWIFLFNFETLKNTILKRFFLHLKPKFENDPIKNNQITCALNAKTRRNPRAPGMVKRYSFYGIGPEAPRLRGPSARARARARALSINPKNSPNRKINFFVGKLTKRWWQKFFISLRATTVQNLSSIRANSAE